MSVSYERGTPVRHWCVNFLLSSEYGTNKTVKARFWPCLSGKFPSHVAGRSEADRLSCMEVVRNRNGGWGRLTRMMPAMVKAMAPPASILPETAAISKSRPVCVTRLGGVL